MNTSLTKEFENYVAQVDAVLEASRMHVGFPGIGQKRDMKRVPLTWDTKQRRGRIMATVAIDVPDDAFAILHRAPKELAQEMRLAAAMLWYTQGRISHGKAAEFAGISRMDFIDALAAAKLPAFHVDIEELREELARARHADRERLAPDLPEPGGTAGDPAAVHTAGHHPG
jgi:predicted HTH domain antitoxin